MSEWTTWDTKENQSCHKEIDAAATEAAAINDAAR